MGSQITYLAKHGYKGALWLLALVGGSLLFGWESLALILLIALLGWIVIFRNPERIALHLSQNALLSPIDGTIKDIQSLNDHCIITIENHLFDVGVLRSPMDIEHYSLTQVHGIPLYLCKAKTFFNSKITCKFGEHSLTLSPRLFHFSPIPSTSRALEKGERMGFMKGEVKLTLKGFESKVNVGDKLRGGESVLGYLK